MKSHVLVSDFIFILPLIEGGNLHVVTLTINRMWLLEVQAVMMLCVQELNKRWRSLQQLAEERSNMLGSAHEVQRFHR